MTLRQPNRTLISQNDAAMIQGARVPRSTFINQWTHKTTFDAGYLVPFMVDEILPGDHMTYDVTAFVRIATLLFPMFDNQRLDTFFFFCPNRLAWVNWVRMMGEQDTPAATIAYTTPQIESPAGGFAINSIYDHMGIPVEGQIAAGETISVNALPFRMYNRIFNEWFRDQNITDSQYNPTDNGPDLAGSYAIHRRAKSHDYFTSALPWPQKFTAPQTLFTGIAPVVGIGILDATNVPASGGTYRESDGGTQAYVASPVFSTVGNGMGVRFDSAGVAGAARYPQIFADLAQATGVTINALRQAWLIQDLLERDARGGTRYTELIRSHFGVTNPDFRLQRPEYIGGGQTSLQLTPIAQTTPTAGGGLGALGAAGTAAGQHRASYAATEHGFIIGIINVRTELSYQQGLHRMWTRLTREEHYFPSLAGLGEQAILRQELYCTGLNTNDLTVFGYQERWHEYRTRVSEVTGMFRSTTAGNIDEWHLAQQFGSAPVLNGDFILDNPPMARVLAAGALAENQQYLADIMINRRAVRPIPMFGTPATLSRF